MSPRPAPPHLRSWSQGLPQPPGPTGLRGSCAGWEGTSGTLPPPSSLRCSAPPRPPPAAPDPSWAPLCPVHTHLRPRCHASPSDPTRLLPPACILPGVDPSVTVTPWLTGEEPGCPVLSLSLQWGRVPLPTRGLRPGPQGGAPKHNHVHSVGTLRAWAVGPSVQPGTLRAPTPGCRRRGGAWPQASCPGVVCSDPALCTDSPAGCPESPFSVNVKSRSRCVF